MSWVIKVGESVAQIVRTETGLVLNNVVQPPGTYTVPTDSQLQFVITVKNVGTIAGTIWAKLVDKKSGKVLLNKSATLSPGTSTRFSVTFTAGNYELEVQAGHGTTVDDTYGC